MCPQIFIKFRTKTTIMKKAFAIVCFVSSAFVFAQQTTGPSLNNRIFNNNSTKPSQKLSLNMKPFMLEDFIQNTGILSEVIRKSNARRLKPSTAMPIFSPEGEFHLEIYEVKEDIDHKLKIFDLEKSKYHSRNLG